MRLGTFPLIGLAAAMLTSCAGPMDLPPQDTAVVLRGVLTTLVACSRPLDADGNIDEAPVAAVGWRPRARRHSFIVRLGDTTTTEDRQVPPARPVRLTSNEHWDYSEWAHPGWQGVLNLMRNGGPVSGRMPGQCDATFYGRDAAAADQALAAMTHLLGNPARRGERSPGGDWLTPRWFEPTIHEVYWRLPFHDVYWVSTDPRLVTVEVRALPNRAELDGVPAEPAPEQNETEGNGL